jgi:hypothetical protein
MFFNGCYGPDNSSSHTTGKRHEQTSGRSTGGAGTSRTIGRGVAESHDVTRLVRNVGTWERGNVGTWDVPTY